MTKLPQRIFLNFINLLKTKQNYVSIIATKSCREFKSSAINFAFENSYELHEASPFMEFHGKWPAMEQQYFIKDLRIIENFISEAEELALFEEVDPYMQRLRYEFDHWDDAIHGYRETERKHWYPHNRLILNRVAQMAFDDEVMPFVHVLDLADKGVIKPHVDSTRYCGSTIAGISLLSNCVMRLVRTDENKYKQTPQISATSKEVQSRNVDDNYRTQTRNCLKNNFYADLLLQRRSLYIMSNTSRYNFTHEVLGNELSKFNGKLVPKTRRISIICRNNA